MPSNASQNTKWLDPEKVAYWYFRLNGYLQIENFVVHPTGRGSQRTDADLLAVRFPYRAERLFDDDKPMQDDACTLGYEPDLIDVVIAEIKANQPCSLNGPWSRKEDKNVHRVLAAVGCIRHSDIAVAATGIYGCGSFENESLRIRLVAVGREKSPGLAEKYSSITQLTWQQILDFIWHRFHAYRNQKTQIHQWDKTGKLLQKLALSEHKRCGPGLFAERAIEAMRPPGCPPRPTGEHSAPTSRRSP